VTLPAAGAVGAAMYWVANRIGGTGGVLAMAVVAALGGLAPWLTARRDPVRPADVTTA
jgi:inorganic phosphate transporter, PiT family